MYVENIESIYIVNQAGNPFLYRHTRQPAGRYP